MWKINKEKLTSLIKVGIIWLGLFFWVFVILFIVPSIVIKDEKFLDIYIISVISVILLIPVLLIIYYSYIAYINNKPKYIDWKYVWKDWCVYEGDWDEKYWANWKWKLTWADWSYYEWEFKNGNLSGRWKKVCPTGETYEWYWEFSKPNWKWKLVKDWNSFEWTRVDWCLEWKWKLIWKDWWIYEWEFKDWKPHWMWMIKMKNWYYYEWEFSDWKRSWRFKKQVLTTWWVIEWEFRDNWSDGFDWIWKVTASNWFVFEWLFKDWELNWEWKMITPEWVLLVWTFEKWEIKEWKQILKNWEYSEWNWIDWHLTWIARYYFNDGSYYEWECGDMWWQWIWTYMTKNGDKYSTEFPYEIINVLMYWLKSKIKEIQWNLNYISKTEKEKADEKNMYLEILKSWTDIQKEIVELSLEEDEKSEKLLNSLKEANSVENLLNFYKGSIKFIEEEEKKYRNIANKYHINFSKRKTPSYSCSQFFFRLDWYCINEIAWGKAFVKIFQFLSSKNILDFVTKREEKNKERVVLIDEFSGKYKEYIQSCLDWRVYEKKFWNHNFKSDKNSD